VSRRVARPYAAALFKVLEKQGVTVLRQIEGELEAVAQALQASPELLRVFEVPTVPWPKKQQLLKELGRRLKMRVESQRLLAALALHYRLRFLADVVAAFRGLVDRREGMVRGTVVLPAAPRAGQIEALAEALKGAMQARVVLESSVQPEMLAGFVVRLGSRVFDGSLKSQLNRFAAAAARANR